MKFDFLKKNERLAPHALLGLAVVFAVLTAAKLWDYQSASADAQSIVSKAVDQDKADPDLLKENLAEFTKIADALKKKNLFVPTVPKHHPVSNVFGIMGSEALINGKWYKVGDKVSDAEVVAVEPTLVRIKWDGKEKTFAPINAKVAVDVKRSVIVLSSSQAEDKKDKPKKPSDKSKKDKSKKPSGKDNAFAWMGVKLSPKLQGILGKMWKNASEEQRREGMAEWNNASKGERREMLSQLEARSDGDRGGERRR